MKIPEPGVNLGMVLTAPAPFPVVKAAPVPVPVVKAAPSLTVVEAAPVAVAPVAPLVKSAAIVAPAAPVAVAPVVKSAVPVTVVAAPRAPHWPLNPAQALPQHDVISLPLRFRDLDKSPFHYPSVIYVIALPVARSVKYFVNRCENCEDQGMLATARSSTLQK
nr:actin cytoskeleton-regulatory complex protein PAN1-like [Penaeus vannamei]